MDLVEKRIRAKNGDIAIYSITRKDSISNILFIHGLGESSQKYFDFAKKIYEKKFSIYLMDLKGHGNSYGKIGDTSPREEILENIHLVVEDIQKDSGGNIQIVGHSMGGNVLVDYLSSKNLPKVTSAVFCSPWIILQKKFRKTQKFLIWFLNVFNPKFIFSRKILKKDEISRFNHDLISARAVRDSNLVEEKLKNKLDIDIPTLIIQGMGDRLCNPRGSRLLASRILNSKYIELELLPHNAILFDTDKIVDLITDWAISV